MNPSRVVIPATIVAILLAAGAARAATFVSGNQAGTWTLAGSPYIVTGDVTVLPATALTIDSGVKVRLRPGRSIIVNGTLVTNGTQPQRVIITADADTTGGSPVPGYWVSVFANAGAFVELNHTDIHFGGAAGWANLATSSGAAAEVTITGGGAYHSAGDGVRVTAERVTVTGAEFSNNAGDGLEVTPGASPSFTAARAFLNGGYAFRITQNAGSLPPDFIGSGNQFDAINVEGVVGGQESPATWTWGANATLSYVVNGTLTVTNADTLELDPGTVIKFGPSALMHITGAGSVLRTTGTSGVPNQFTSLRDDIIGGDTNGDGSATVPSPGDWISVFANNGASLDLRSARFHYGGAGGWANVSTSSGILDSATWDGGGSFFSANDGVRVAFTNGSFTGDFNDNVQDGLELIPTNPPVFPGPLAGFRNGGYVVRVTQNPGSFPGQWVGANNGRNAVFVNGTLGGATADRKWTWGGAGLPYVIGVVTCSGSDTLEIGLPGIIKFENAGSYLQVVGNGSLLRTQNPTWFTSLRDDAHGGDTNGDGAATSPAPGDWLGVILNDQSRADLVGTSFAYGGSSGGASLWNTSGVATSLIWNGGGTFHSANDGARVTVHAASIAGFEASNNAADGIDLTPIDPPTFGPVTAYDNGGYALRVNQNPGHFPASFSGAGNGRTGVFVSGNLGGNAPDQRWTWGANPTFPYIVHTLTCSASDTLEIAAGAVVKFDQPSSYLQVSGGGSQLRTLGTEAQPVWFSSIRDDAHGGDTNDDGLGSSPTPGDWIAIFANNDGSIDLSHTWVGWGGGGGWAAVTSSSGIVSSFAWNGGGVIQSANDGIRVSGTAASLTDLEARNNAHDGVELAFSMPPAFDRIACHDNGGYGMRVMNSPGSIPGTLSGSGNGVNGVFVNGNLGGVAPDRRWTWGATEEFPVVVSDLNVGSADSLEVLAGAVVKFETGRYLQIIGGTARLIASGTPDNPVWFTSLRNDAQGGDTNGDGAASTPAPGDWISIFLNQGGAADLTDTWVTHGGGSGWSNLAASSGTGALNWTRGGSTHSATSGIQGGITMNLAGVRLTDNASHGATVTPAGASSAIGCDIHSNGGSGVINGSSSITIEATGSWWGDAAGPFDPSTGPPDHNPNGLGDQVSDYVAYREWATSAITNLPPVGFALVAPAVGATEPDGEVTFSWRSSTDPDGGAVTYKLTADEDPNFGSPLLELTGLADTTYDAIDLPGGVPIYWRVIARDAGGAGRTAVPQPSWFTIESVAGVDPASESNVPEIFHVRAPYPNPFQETVTLAFALPERTSVAVNVYDVGGRLVNTVASGEKAPGHWSVQWDGRDADGRVSPAGIYFMRLAAGDHVSAKRIVLTR